MNQNHPKINSLFANLTNKHMISPIKVEKTPRQTLATVFWGQNSEILDSIQKDNPLKASE